MPVKIIKPGLFTTIQDQGRFGYRSSGIGPGGAMDFFAASVANILAGNDENLPVIEMHFPAAEMLFDEDLLICITGADFDGFVNEGPVTLWKPFLIKKNDRLYFKKPLKGARAYLSIRGGINAHNWLNSFSTHSKLKAGGFSGRALLKNDTIELPGNLSLPYSEDFPEIAGLIASVYEPVNLIRCIAGPEWELLTDESKNKLLQAPFMVTSQSDRMGYRLKGPDLVPESMLQLISSPVDLGTVQLFPNGQLIVLMADHQATGGYARIANVISADIPRLAQLPVHNEMKFDLVNITTAEESLFSLQQIMETIKDISKNYHENHRHQL